MPLRNSLYKLHGTVATAQRIAHSALKNPALRRQRLILHFRSMFRRLQVGSRFLSALCALCAIIITSVHLQVNGPVVSTILILPVILFFDGRRYIAVWVRTSHSTAKALITFNTRIDPP